MQRALLLLAAGVLVVGLSVMPAFGKPVTSTVTVLFNGTDGVSSSLWWSDSMTGNGGTNTGAEPGIVKLSQPDVDWYFPAALFRANLPADLIGGTPLTATFTLKETWWNCALTDVELRQIDCPVTWDPGDGTAAGRWGAPDNGAQRLFADWDVAAGKGLNWSGVEVDWATGTAAGTRTEFDLTAMGDLIDTQDIAAGGYGSFDVLSLVKNWANGTWDNDGFCLWMGNGSATSTDDLHTSYGGLVIEYIPVPEPVSMVLLGLGALAALRRRK